MGAYVNSTVVERKKERKERKEGKRTGISSSSFPFHCLASDGNKFKEM